MARRIDKLPPIGTLLLLVLPAGAVLPLKMLAFWLMTTGAWIEGVGVFVFAKLGAIGTTAFVFEAGRDKLLQLAWFHAFYRRVMWLRRRAHELVDPIAQRIKYRMRILGLKRAPRAFRLLQRIRRRMHLPPPLSQEGT